MIDETIDGRYEVVRFIGEGGMGAVYEARHVATRRRVALKLISEEAANDPERLARFRVEAKAAGRIDSDHITQVFDLGHDSERDTPYMAMEYLDGEDLEALFERRGRLPLHLGLRIICQALYGLSRAHEAGVTHRDIKPANIFLSKRDNGRCVVKLLDFGIAKIRNTHLSMSASTSSGITSGGMLIGSPLYMSPEQTKTFKGLDPRTDVWSMGVVLYQALVGVTPFETDAGIGDLILAINTAPVRVREAAPWVPEPVARVIEKALTVSGKGRYQNATEMAAALDALLPRGADIDHDELDVVEPTSMPGGTFGDTLAVEAPPPPEDEDEQPTMVRTSAAPSMSEAPETVPDERLPRSVGDEIPPTTVPEERVAGAAAGEEASAEEAPPTTIPADPPVTLRDEPFTMRAAEAPKRVSRPAAVASPSGEEGTNWGRVLAVVAAVGFLGTGVAAFALRDDGATPTPDPSSSAVSTEPAASGEPPPVEPSASVDASSDASSEPVSDDTPDDEVAGPMPTAAWSDPPAQPKASAGPPATGKPKATASATAPKPKPPPEPVPPEPVPPEPVPPEPVPPEPVPPEPVPAPPEPVPEPPPPADTAPPAPPAPAPPKPAPSPAPPIAPKL